MKITIPAYEPIFKGNEHLRHNEIEIELGEDVIEVIRCKDCGNRTICGLPQYFGNNGYCSCGKRSS